MDNDPTVDSGLEGVVVAESALTGAVGALKGPLYGGAPGPVRDMLDAIGADGDPRQYLQEQLRLGHRIMGMGHRIYRCARSALGGAPRCNAHAAVRADGQRATGGASVDNSDRMVDRGANRPL